MILLYMMAAALFAVSGLVLALSHRRMDKARAYAGEAAARSAALSGLARARLALESGDWGYEGGEVSWPGGQKADIRVFKAGNQFPSFEITVLGTCRYGRKGKAIRTASALFETRDGQVVLVSADLKPRPDLSRLR